MMCLSFGGSLFCDSIFRNKADTDGFAALCVDPLEPSWVRCDTFELYESEKSLKVENSTFDKQFL